jgi:hypothetical protein
MAKQTKRSDAQVSENIDQASAESFPASDPPSWTLGAGSSAPPSPPGSLATPAPRAALSFDAESGPSPADLLARMRSPDSALLWTGSVAAATGFLLTLAGQDRLGRAFGQGALALMMVGVLRRLAQLGERVGGQVVH